MIGRRKRMWLAAGAVAAGLFVLAAWRLPVMPLLTFLQFRVWPEQARLQHLVLLQHPGTGQELFVLGTTHEHHYRDAAYSVWHLKAALLALRPDTVFIESMPAEVLAGAWGEGPIEMPFVALAAREAGAKVVGIDAGWEGAWRGRQRQMFENLRAGLLPVRRGVVACGFMHVLSFVDQLESEGFVRVPLADRDKEQVLDGPVDRTWPAGMRAALEAAIARAPGRIQDAAELERYVALRRQVLDGMK